jgi:hypothetical protein
LEERLRYFYTDALAAAWMSKHFGMRLQFTIPLMSVEKSMKIGDYAIARWHESGEKIYIHPDSLSILEPQVGDIVEYKWNIKPTLDAIIDKEQPHNIVEEEWAYEVSDVFSESQLQDLKDPSRRKDVKIIQGGGIPFMWPEVE